MSSTVYMPLITSFKRKQPFPANSVGNQNIQENQLQPDSLIADTRFYEQENGAQVGSVKTLQSLQRNPNEKVPLSAVINDFNNTMDALGVDNSIQKEVAHYLTTVQLHASSEAPSEAYIRQTLKISGKTLDRFIATALKKPSSVVSDWVEAMLGQDIQFRSDLSPAERNALLLHEIEIERTEPVTQTEKPVEKNMSTRIQTVEADKIDKSHIEIMETIHQLTQQARSAFQTEETEKALSLIDDAYQLASVELNNPGLNGKLKLQKAKWEETLTKNEDAILSYNTAVHYFDKANLLDKKAKSMYSLAGLYELLGNSNAAIENYEAVLELSTRTPSLDVLALKSRNHLGSLYVLQKRAEASITVFKEAVSNFDANGLSVPISFKSDVYANLARAYQTLGLPVDAKQQYSNAIKAAKTAKDKSRYTNLLKQYANLMVESNQTDEALSVLKRLQKL
ncbi:MAG: tetratricopeptide repeat protein [Cyanobacteria bacterium P01_H01_bin.74]